MDYVIWSFEHKAWWAPNRYGYTRLLQEAGRYTKEQAEDIVADANIVPGTENERALTLDEATRSGPPKAA
jgi:hypothetical protein